MLTTDGHVIIACSMKLQMEIKKRSNNNCDIIGKASTANVSSNTPNADEASI